MIFAAGAGGVVDGRGPGLEWRELAAKSQTASRSWRLTAHRKPTETCLPDWRVTGATPARPASDPGPAVPGLGEQPRGAHGPGAGQGGEDMRIGMGGKLGGDLGLQGLDLGGQRGERGHQGAGDGRPRRPRQTPGGAACSRARSCPGPAVEPVVLGAGGPAARPQVLHLPGGDHYQRQPLYRFKTDIDTVTWGLAG